MAQKSEYRGLTRETLKLLNEHENLYVDFKEDARAIKSDDLVAFANAPQGGTILIGVREIKNGGVQRGEIVGCEDIDLAKNLITSKSGNCTPQINVHMVVENTSKKPILRVIIPTGSEKPYMTHSGTYKIRSDASNRAFTPNQLLNIFVEGETKKFVNNFSEATQQLEETLNGIKQTFSQELKNLRKELIELETDTEGRLKTIFKLADEACELSNEAANFSDETQVEVAILKEKLNKFIDVDFAEFKKDFKEFTQLHKKQL